MNPPPTNNEHVLTEPPPSKAQMPKTECIHNESNCPRLYIISVVYQAVVCLFV